MVTLVIHVTPRLVACFLAVVFLTIFGFWSVIRHDDPTNLLDPPQQAAFLGLSSDVGIPSIPPRARHLRETEWENAGTTPVARIAYFVMGSGKQDVATLRRLMPAIYSPKNFYLVHLDQKTEAQAVEDMREFLSVMQVGAEPNAKLLEPSMIVTWGGFSITLAAMYGLSTLVQWSTEWDYFINLSASDFPLLSQVEIGTVLGSVLHEYKSFMTGNLLESLGVEMNRMWTHTDDQGLYRGESRDHPVHLPLGHPTVRRPTPTLFQVYKGEFWVVLHRAFADYMAYSPDNVARTLFTYFSQFRISDESFFQTIACHPKVPSHFTLQGDNLRHINWPLDGEWHLHPEPITESQVPEIMASGALFARKFSLYKTDCSMALARIEQELRSTENSKLRIERALQRVRHGTTDTKFQTGSICAPFEPLHLGREAAKV